MGNSVLGVGISGLNAAQAGLVTTGHNIANANTPGYHRQRIDQTNATPQANGFGFLGQGTQIVSVERMYSDLLETQLTQAQASASYLSTYQSQVSEIDNMLADPNAGLTPALQDFFSSVQDVATNPSSVDSRQGMLSSASELVARFQSLDARLGDMRSGVNSQITDTVASINSYADQIASLNGKISAAQAATGQPPNDLLDQRDALVSSLNQLAGVSVTKQSDGSLNIMIGSGQNLVTGQQAMHLSAVASPDDPTRIEVGYATGSSNAIISSALTGGSLGAVLAYRNEMLDTTQNALGRIAIALGQNVNDQQRLGQDLNGLPGGNFFNVPAPTVLTASSNTGNAAVSAAIVAPGSLTTSDYRVTYTGGNYSITRLSDGTVSGPFATLPQTVDGVSIALASGAPANGDSFLVEPTCAGARSLTVAISDGSEIAAAAPIRTSAALANNSSASISTGTVNAPPPPNANLQQPVTITFTGAGTFNVTGTGTGNPTGVAYTSGGNISYNGWTIQISGAPAAGDTFSIGPNTSGVADNRNALLLAGLQVGNQIAGGTATYQGAYSQMVNSVGNKARETRVTSQAQDALVTQSQQAQQALSGVNLDEEAANLIRYQQAYQASAKLIDVASKLFDTLLNIGS